MKNKFAFLLVLFSAVLINGFGQISIVSQTVTGGSLSDSLTVYLLTSDGGSMAGGSSFSDRSGDKAENSKGAMDLWVVKYDRLGAIQWQKTIGGSGEDRLTSMQQTSDHGYILGGYSDSKISGDKKERGWLKYDYWLVKLDSMGTIQWDKTIGGNEQDRSYIVKQTSDGGYIVGGTSKSPISGLKTQDSWALSFDHWIVKTDSLGVVQWDRTIGGFAFEQLTAIEENIEGSFILGGYSESDVSGQKTEPKRGIFDYWLVKIDAQGNFLWDKTIGGGKRDQLTDMKLTKDGGYILAGFSESKVSGEKWEPNRGVVGTVDYWVVKLDSARNIEWQKTIGGSLNDSCNSIALTKDGGYILGGYSQSGISGDKTEDCKGATDYWVVKLSSSGMIEWQRTIGGSGVDNLIRIIETKKNSFTLAGYSASGISGDKTGASKGGLDYWIVKLKYKAQVAAIDMVRKKSSGLKNGDKNSFRVGPNPATDELKIWTAKKTSITLTDRLGNTLLTKTIEGSGIINIAKLPNGLYQLKNNATGAVKMIMVSK